MGPAGPCPEIHRDKYAEGSGFPALGADDDRPPPPSKSCLTSRTKSPFHVRNCTIVHKLSSLLSRLPRVASPLISNWTGQEDEFGVGLLVRVRRTVAVLALQNGELARTHEILKGTKQLIGGLSNLLLQGSCGQLTMI